jgi:hypothetical protein
MRGRRIPRRLLKRNRDLFYLCDDAISGYCARVPITL